MKKVKFSDEVIKNASEVVNKCSGEKCRICMKECVMMNAYGTCPKEILKPLVEGQGMDEMLAYSCNTCGKCVVICPYNLPMNKVFMDSRKDFVKANGGKSPIKGHGAIKLHQYLGFSKIFTMKKKGGGK